MRSEWKHRDAEDRERGRMNMTSGLYVAMAAVVWAVGCSPSENPSGPGGSEAKKMLPVAVRTARVQPGEISERLQFTGELESPLSVSVSSKAQGRLWRLQRESGAGITEGVEVKKGEVIAEIEHRDLEAQLALAQAQVRQTEAALVDKERERRRMEALFAQEVATEQARDAAVAAHESARAALEQAQAQRDLARVNLEESFLRAPMDGVVAERYVDPGAMVGSSTPIVRLVQMSPLRLRVSVPARLLPILRPGETPVDVRTDVYPDRAFGSVVERIFPTVDPATRTAPVEILLKNERHEDGQWVLRPGMYATAEIRMAIRTSALMVPASSVLRVLDRQIVFVVEGDAARAATVKTGIRSGDQVEITDGLAAGDEFVVMGQNKLTDGVRVERVKDAAKDEPPAK